MSELADVEQRLPATGAVAERRGLRIDGDRLLGRIDRLRQVGGTADGGVHRLAFTKEDVAGRELVRGFMREAGLEVHTDEAGNIIGSRPADSAPAAPTLLIGSHTDTVPDGGALDGAYGVLAGIEVLHTLHDHRVRLERPAAVVVFANEEGASGTRGMWGSHAFAGALEPGDLAMCDRAGTPIAELAARIGGDLDRVADAAWHPDRIAAFIELHIEQGPVLEHLDAEIGIVEAISGRLTVDVIVRGEANHAGTTPMELRRDALAGAAHLIVEVQRLAGADGVVRVATVGSIAIEPNAWNVVPGTARMRVDLRDVSVEAIEAGLDRLRRAAAEIGDRTGTVIEVRPDQLVDPVACHPRLQGLIAEAADRLGFRRFALPSGAGHDAQVIGRVAPAAMIFVPSIGGLSHVPAEDTAPWHLVAGADVLLQTVLGFDPGPG
ncbi:Zn-dependent hydrolase [Amycolatopsis antarctica]|uniref:Zn-dependent hydrolase n=1 Tax=Amycolatopsis antarctica TaxID=1854586 RepID=A0A263CZ23_9PSEU|nr:Zn-dependent hydrolase [Amycolatopsis antarctica]OZM71148.1 Zn-dependent hydrolase [Amycolatopsis antarctica]